MSIESIPIGWRSAGDWTVTATQEHFYIDGGPAGEDEGFDNWVEGFREKGIPYVVTESVTEDGLPQRTLYKHLTKFRDQKLVTCCRFFNEQVEGRDLKAEAAYCGARKVQR